MIFLFVIQKMNLEFKLLNTANGIIICLDKFVKDSGINKKEPI